MARFNALRDALEEDVFLRDIGPEAEGEPSLIDHGNTTMARAAGLRARPPVAADWREKEAERVARERMDAERMVPSPEMLSRVAERSRDPGLTLTSPIPVTSASPTRDALAPTTSAIAPVTSASPAGKPDSSGKDGMPAPSSEGAGGDSSERDLYLARLAAQSAAGFGGMGAGKNIDMGIADTLGERLKQVQALRAKREERAADVAQEQAQYEGANLATLATNLAAFEGRPEIRAALENLRPGAKFTKPSDFIKSVYQAVTNPPTVAKKEAEVPLVEARKDVAAATAKATPKKVDIAAAAQAERELEGRRRDAREWARIRAGSRQAAAKLTEGKPEAFRKEVNEKTQALGTSVSKEYGEIGAALQEADRALLGVKGVSPDLFAKVAQATRLDTLNTPEERALFRSIGELRRAAQKAQSGLAVTEPERQEFLQTFGQNWTQSPSTLLEAIEWMRRKTRDKLKTSFATYRAQGDVGNTAIQAYEQAGGVTPNAEYLKPFSERAPRTAGAAAPAPTTQVGGMVKVRHKATGKTATVDRAKADEMLKRPDFEEVK